VAALDRVKEEIAYLKFWQGVGVVTDITLGGWVISAPATATTWSFALAMGGVLLLTLAVLILHRRIERRIVQMEVL
jgi:LPXTG-motif cell wall-anchored protein